MHAVDRLRRSGVQRMLVLPEARSRLRRGIMSRACPGLCASAPSLNRDGFLHGYRSVQCSCPGLLACASSKVGALLVPCARCIKEHPRCGGAWCARQLAGGISPAFVGLGPTAAFLGRQLCGPWVPQPRGCSSESI